MASAQCHRTCQESCQQKSHHGSLGQKVTDMFKGHHNNHPNAGTQTQCYTQTQVVSKSGQCATAKTTQTEYRCSQTQTTQSTATTTTTKCHGNGRTCSKRENKRNLFQKIKDGLSGHSSDSCSSESESDSDNENCRNRK